MASQATVILAVALSLSLCLLILFIACLALWFRFRRLRAYDLDCLCAANHNNAKLEKKLAAFPKEWDEIHEDCGFSEEEVKYAYGDVVTAVRSYASNWIHPDDTSLPSKKELVDEPSDESTAQIEAILFSEPLRGHYLTIGKDARTFPNPHHYTAAEISTLLKQKRTREFISIHIMMSILIMAISSDGNPLESLLPFAAGDTHALYKLLGLIRGVELFHSVPAHISKFGIRYGRRNIPPDLPSRVRWITLFESLFSPYFKTISPTDVFKRRQELRTLLDTVTQLGLKIIGCPHSTMEFRWEERDPIMIMINPALYSLGYKDDKLVSSRELWNTFPVRAVWD